MKRTIRHLATLLAAALLGAPSALAADCLFVPSASAGDAVPDRTVGVSAIGAENG